MRSSLLLPSYELAKEKLLSTNLHPFHPSTPFSSRFAFTIRPWIFADKSRNLRSHLSCPISAETPPLGPTEYQQQIARQFSKTIDKAVFTTLFNVIHPYFVRFFFFQWLIVDKMAESHEIWKNFNKCVFEINL